ncbi:MAG: antitoxin AF2212-like protein [Pirellulaceae bacterium]
MTITVQATYENGVLRPKQALPLTEGMEVHLAITPVDENSCPPAADRDPLAGLIGMFSSGRSDGAENHDKYLYGKRP